MRWLEPLPDRLPQSRDSGRLSATRGQEPELGFGKGWQTETRVAGTELGRERRLVETSGDARAGHIHSSTFTGTSGSYA